MLFSLFTHKFQFPQRLQDWVAIESDSSDALKRQELIQMMHTAEERIKQLGGTVELVELGEQQVRHFCCAVSMKIVLLCNEGHPRPYLCYTIYQFVCFHVCISILSSFFFFHALSLHCFS